MPNGFVNTKETQLRGNDFLLPSSIGNSLIKCWLAVPLVGRIPHWDIVSTCTIDDKAGLLLVEAKAHDQKLIKENVGKRRYKIE